MGTIQNYLIDETDELELDAIQGKDPDELTVKNLLDISDEVLEKYYEIGRKLLQEERFQEASKVFYFLTFLSPYYSNFWHALGLAEHMQGNEVEAIPSYMLAAEMDPNNIAALSNLIACLIACNKTEMLINICNKVKEQEETDQNRLLKGEVEKILNLVSSKS